MKVLLDIHPFFLASIEAERLAVANSPGGPTFLTVEEFVQWWAGRGIDELFDKHKARPTPVVIDGVPQEITKRQAHQELIDMGLHNSEDFALSEVMKCIALIADAKVRQLMRSWFLDSTHFLRQQPELVAMWVTAAPAGLGKTLPELDAAFIRANRR